MQPGQVFDVQHPGVKNNNYFDSSNSTKLITKQCAQEPRRYFYVQIKSNKENLNHATLVYSTREGSNVELLGTFCSTYKYRVTELPICSSCLLVQSFCSVLWYIFLRSSEEYLILQISWRDQEALCYFENYMVTFYQNIRWYLGGTLSCFAREFQEFIVARL